MSLSPFSNLIRTWLLVRLTLLYCLLLVLPACTTIHSLTQSGFRPAEVPAMLLAPPVSTIGSVERGNRVVFDGEATQASVYLLRQLLLAHKSELRLSSELVVPDSLRQAAAQEIREAAWRLAGRIQLTGGAKLPVLDYLLRQQGQRYMLVPMARGFTRAKGNYGGELVKSIGIGLLTMDMVGLAVKAESEIGVFIYDGQQHAIVYSSRTPPAKREPLNNASVEKQLQKLLGRDFPFVPQL